MPGPSSVNTEHEVCEIPLSSGAVSLPALGISRSITYMFIFFVSIVFLFSGLVADAVCAKEKVKLNIKSKTSSFRVVIVFIVVCFKVCMTKLADQPVGRLSHMIQ